MTKTFLVEFKKESKDQPGRHIRKSRLAVKDSEFHVELFQDKSKSATGKQDDRERYLFHADADSGKSPWDEAHELMEHFAQEGQPVDFVEPEMDHLLFNPKQLPKSKMAGSYGFLKNWPQPEWNPEVPYAWHLDEHHSQLKMAREKVASYFEKGRIVKIAHFDTGYDPKHPCKPKNLKTDQAFCFIPGETGPYAHDVDTGSSLDQQWHGTATLAILAGGYVESFDGKTPFQMEFGGAPQAEVVPIRVSDSVALLKTSAFAKALEYATDIGCEVVTMSMAGLPSIQWARAVNRAYESGVVIVTAAGNSWVNGPMKFLPKCVLYPGRWDRVLAATGITCNSHPYVFDANPFKRPQESEGLPHSEFMQGNFGPSDSMGTALAAYTPNLPWAARDDKGHFWSLSGGGTSSATPQIAAASALWIQRYRAELEASGYAGTWKQVEAVRHALFASSDKTPADYQKYLGKGALRAFDALDPKYFPTHDQLKISKKATVFLPLIELFFGGQKAVAQPFPMQQEMLATELLQLAHLDPDLQALISMDFTDSDRASRKNLPSMEELMALRYAVKLSNASGHLKGYLGV